MIIYHHLGLGDHIICNGLVRFLAKEHSVELICKDRNSHNIKIMYEDNNNIIIIPVKNDNEALEKTRIKSDALLLGMHLNKQCHKKCSWDQMFYEQAGVDFENSWSCFKYNKTHNQVSIPDKPYAFVSNKGSDGIDRIDYTKIDPTLEIIYSNTSSSFFDNIDLIINANEIHCINSAYIHFIDRISINDKCKLFFHKLYIPRINSNFTTKKNWNIV